MISSFRSQVVEHPVCHTNWHNWSTDRARVQKQLNKGHGFELKRITLGQWNVAVEITIQYGKPTWNGASDFPLPRFELPVPLIRSTPYASPKIKRARAGRGLLLAKFDPTAHLGTNLWCRKHPTQQMYPNATNRTNLWFDKQENIFIFYIFTRPFIEEIFWYELLFRIPLSDPIPPHSTILFFQNFLL